MLADPAGLDAAEAWLGTDPRVGSVLRSTDPASGPTRLEVGFDGDTAAQASLLAAMVAAGHRVSGFSQATSDLEELFLQVTGQQDSEEAA